jgi:hypothetical protein
VAAEEGSSRVFESENGERWTAVTLPEFVGAGVDASDGTLWVSGGGGVIWKWVPERIALTAGLNTEGRFMMRIRVPGPGRYVVYSTGLSGPPAAKTWIERDVLEITEEATWTETIHEDAWIYVVNRE